MKAKYLQVIMVIIISWLISCNKDENSEPRGTSSMFTYDGKQYPLDKGYIHHDLDRRFDVSFFSSSVSVNPQNGALFLDGKGDGLILILDSKTTTDLSSATYKWPSQTIPDSAMIADAQMGISNDITNTINGTFRAATYGVGSVTVSKSGQQYTIEFSFSIDGKTASGKYTGTLQTY